MKKIGYVCPECGHKFEKNEISYNYDTCCFDLVCLKCCWCGTDQMLNEDDEETPYSDIIDYADQHGIYALGFALYQIAKTKDIELNWDLAREIYEYDGRNE